MRDGAESWWIKKSECMLRSYLEILLWDDRINKSEKMFIIIDDVQPEI
jgi:hypothetical protein